MLWFAWFNGSLYVELHGREDGRTRLLVFLQMGLLALLAVFTGWNIYDKPGPSWRMLLDRLMASSARP